MCKKHIRLSRQYRAARRHTIERHRNNLHPHTYIPNAETISAMEECICGMQGEKSYTDVDEMINDILSA